MNYYRLKTPHRTGKWYPDLTMAYRQACAIGAGYYDTRSAVFYPYPGTEVETREDQIANAA